MATKSNTIKFIISQILMVFYSTCIGIVLVFAYIFNKKVFEVKERLHPPTRLTSDEYGVHKFADVNGIKIHYVEKGDQSNPLIIFVHGYPEFWYCWRHQIKEFSKDYWTIAIDQRGYGQSDKPRNASAYHINNMADDINALVKSLGRDKFILIAHDWGAVVGFNYVYRYMDTLQKYIMIGGPETNIWKKLVFGSFKQFIMSWYIFFFRTPFLPEIFLRTNDFKVFNTFGNQEDVECYKYTFSKFDAFCCPLNYYRSIPILNPDPKIPAPTKTAPGLFLIGEYDMFISKDTGKLIKEKLDKLDFQIIKGANHFAQHHKPEETNRMIREFLEKK